MFTDLNGRREERAVSCIWNQSKAVDRFGKQIVLTLEESFCMVFPMKLPPAPLPTETKGEYEVALEQVLGYLSAEYFSGNAREGERLPSVRALAGQLSVSNAVVHAVYRRLREEGRLVSSVGKGTFLVTPGQLQEKPIKRPCIAISASIHAVPNSEWGDAVIVSIMKASTRGDRRVSILPFSAEVRNISEAAHLLKEEVNEVDGLICFPIASRQIEQDLLDVYTAAGKPVIRINSPEINSTQNFVSVDYFRSGYTVGQAFLRTGRRALLFIGVEVPRGSVSAVQRITGIQLAMMEYPDAAPLRVVNARNITREAGYEAMKRLLNSGYRPDAICTFGDYQAFGAIDALKEHGLSIPQQVSVIGGTGLSIHEKQLSMIASPGDELGEELIQMILTCIENKGRPLPGVYTPARFSVANTTRPEENAILAADGKFRKKE